MHPTDIALVGLILAVGLVGIAALPWRARQQAAVSYSIAAIVQKVRRWTA